MYNEIKAEIAKKRDALQKTMERVMRIELTLSAWEAAALPLCYTRTLFYIHENSLLVKQILPDLFRHLLIQRLFQILQHQRKHIIALIFRCFLRQFSG